MKQKEETSRKIVSIMFFFLFFFFGACSPSDPRGAKKTTVLFALQG